MTFIVVDDPSWDEPLWARAYPDDSPFDNMMRDLAARAVGRAAIDHDLGPDLGLGL